MTTETEERSHEPAARHSPDPLLSSTPRRLPAIEATSAPCECRFCEVFYGIAACLHHNRKMSEGVGGIYQRVLGLSRVYILEGVGNRV